MRTDGPASSAVCHGAPRIASVFLLTRLRLPLILITARRSTGTTFWAQERARKKVMNLQTSWCISEREEQLGTTANGASTGVHTVGKELDEATMAQA